MASTDFEKVLIKDDRLSCTDKIKYGVLKGGQNVTSQTFNAISKSTSAHVFNIQVPSLETIISREVLWTADFTLKIEAGPNVDKATNFPYMFMLNYGVTDALGPFPLHQLVSTMTATINNNSISMNVQDVLPALLRMCDPDELAQYDSTTPTMLDYNANYRDGIDVLEYQIVSAVTGADATTRRPVILSVGNNTAPVAGAVYGAATTKFISYSSNVLAYDKWRAAASGQNRKPRGTFVIKRISTAAEYAAIAGVANTTIPAQGSTTVYCDIQITEPLLLSPFIFGSPENKQGFYGITNMNFQMNMAANANRAWRSVKFREVPPAASAVFIKNATVTNFKSSQLTFTFLTGHASDVLSSKNIVPFYELPIYRTQGAMTIPARSNLVDLGGKFDDPVIYEVKSNTIQLNVIPDKLVIYTKRINMTTGDADSHLTIENININWNNNAGLLSNMTKEQLYKSSVLSGLKNMSWAEFSGSTICTSNTNYKNYWSESSAGYTGVGAYAPFGNETEDIHRTPGFQLVPTVGSVLVLNFAEVIQLTEDYYAPGSLGSFSLQVNVKVQNTQVEPWNAGEWELLIIPMTSGIFVNERGTSSVYTGLLTKADVLSASTEQEHYSHGTIKRMIGGSLLSNLRSAMSWISSKLPFVKNALNKIDHPYAKVGHDVLNTLGYGKSGAGSSGGLQNRLM